MSKDLSEGSASARRAKKWLNVARLRMGMANLFFSGEETSLSALKIMIIKALGGNDIHIGFISSFGAIASFTQWIGVVLLKYFRSNRKAMAFALGIGVVSGFLLSLSVAFSDVVPAWKNALLWFFLMSTLVMCIATGIQLNVEGNWIGDIVPLRLRGWFTSMKSSISVIGIIVLALLFGFVIDNSPDILSASAWLYVVVALSHILGIALILKVPDKKPQIANFFSRGKSGHERLNYASFSLGCYTSFYILWAGGRAIFFTFSTIFLMEQFGMGLFQLGGLGVVNSIVSVITLFILGKISDRRGNRILLIIVSGCVALSMFLWPFSTWLGIGAIVASFVVNGLAGAAHSMLIANYGLEIFPEKGRSGYLAFVRIVTGAATIVLVNSTAIFSRYLEYTNWKWEVFGSVITRYHLIFMIGICVSLCSLIPLIVVGNRKVSANPESEEAPATSK